MVAQGEPRDLAARKIGTSLHQINILARTNQDFAALLAEAYEVGRPLYQEWLRAQWRQRIEEGNWPALRDAIVTHLPEGAALRTTRHEIGGIDGAEIKMIVERVIPGLPLPVLEQMMRHLDEGEQPLELPRAS
jgi:hypothetical protein